MPSLGADMDAGTLVEWLVKPGDWVKRGDVVAVVETQKGAIEIETYQPGQIEKFLVDLNSKVPVGTPLAQIRTEGEAKPAAVAPPAAADRLSRRLRGAGRSLHAAGGRLFACHRRRPSLPSSWPSARVARRATACRRARHRSFNADRQRPGGGDHLCRRRAPSRGGRRSAGKEAGARARSRRDADGHRRRHGAIEAGNPALLS